MIFIANDVGSKELLPDFLSANLDAELAELEFSDFFFVGNGPSGDINVGVERKTLRDILQCIRMTNRFTGHQLPGLQRSFHFAFLLIEGAYRSHPESGLLQDWRGGRDGSWQDVKLGSQRFLHSELQRFLISVSTMTDVKVWKTRTKTETVNFVADLYHQLHNKRWDEHKSVFAIQMPEIREPMRLTKMTRQDELFLQKRKFAMLFDGIGQDVSKAAATHFRSIREAANADEKAWREVEGVGKTISKKIVQDVTGELK